MFLCICNNTACFQVFNCFFRWRYKVMHYFCFNLELTEHIRNWIFFHIHIYSIPIVKFCFLICEITNNNSPVLLFLWQVTYFFFFLSFLESHGIFLVTGGVTGSHILVLQAVHRYKGLVEFFLIYFSLLNLFFLHLLFFCKTYVWWCLK